jgi:hypothetical protein
MSDFAFLDNNTLEIDRVAQRSPETSIEHRVAMNNRWLSECVIELNTLKDKPEALATITDDFPMLITAYTRLGLILELLSQQKAA